MAEAEASWASPDGLACLVDGLGRLADVIETESPAEARTAANLAATYAGRMYARVRDKIERDAQVPEPALEHYFKVVLAFDQVESSLPASANETKIAIVKALIDRYYEGHSPEQKRAAIEQLAGLRSER
jgi:hypothetical protein